jgi:hypothetical protein
MQTTQCRFCADGEWFAAAVARIETRKEITNRRIGNTGTQRHMGPSAIVVGDPGFEGETQMWHER